MLDHNPITVRVFERSSTPIPVRVERRDGHEPGRNHSGYRRFPLPRIRLVEDQKIILCWSATGGMAVDAGKLKVIRRAPPTKHDAVKAFVALEAEQEIEAEAVLIERNQSINVIRRSSNAELGNGGA